MPEQPLWAKPAKQDLRLWRHLFDTEEAALAIFDAQTRWGKAWLRFFKIPEERHPSFMQHLQIACLFHDIGKANEEFQQRMLDKKDVLKVLRHEHLSALVLHLPAVQNWITQNSKLDWNVITAAVLSHHYKADRGGKLDANGRPLFKWGQFQEQDNTGIYLNHPEVTKTLKRIAEIGGLSDPPLLPSGRWSGNLSPWNVALEKGLEASRDLDRWCREKEGYRNFMLAVKAGVIVADSVASAVRRIGKDSIPDWIRRAAHIPTLGSNDISEAIIDPRIRQLYHAGKWGQWHDFQRGADTVGPRVLLRTAAGSGKTLYGWRWAEAQARTRSIGHVLFLYPTRATANEGFRDYVSWAPETDATLLHSSSRFELENLLINPSEGSRGKNGNRDKDFQQGKDRFFALGQWDRKYFSATVDQILGFMEHAYSSTCLLPVLADSAVIIDEIHSFDPHMFEVLIAFLKAFDVPVLCMTATLPASRRKALENVGMRVYPSQSEGNLLLDLQKKEQHPRYRIHRLPDAIEARKVALQAYKDGLRVLWVVNTVKRAQRVAADLSNDVSDVICYHSRFKLTDRWNRHQDTIQAFQNSNAPRIAVTTQVCEMSLDLDADVLITEDARLTSLVQRFGRANRHLIRGEAFRAQMYVYPIPRDTKGWWKPYNMQDFAKIDAFLTPFKGVDVSQAQLEEALRQHVPAETAPSGFSAFLEGGYFAVPGDFRDAEDEYVRSCVLTSDLAEVEQLVLANKKHLVDGFLVPVLVKQIPVIGLEPPWFVKAYPYLKVADSLYYSKEFGFWAD